MTDAIARDYIDRPDATRRNDLLQRDYVGGTRPTPPAYEPEPRRFWTQSRLRKLTSTYAITGVVGAIGAYTAVNGMGDVTINGEAMGAPDFWTVFLLFLALAVIVTLGTEYALYKVGVDR